MIAEEDDAPFCDQKGEFVFLLVCEVSELETDNFSADVTCQMLNLFCCGEKSFLAWVCECSCVCVVPVVVSDGEDILVVQWNVWAIL